MKKVLFRIFGFLFVIFIFVVYLYVVKFFFWVEVVDGIFFSVVFVVFFVVGLLIVKLVGDFLMK